ncbi:hypothetical protein K1W54_15620 [Micromonospora sp. CPCC 205371]|nr:hypothetical protein [Micromonospora sp. CPCC 205371]
MKQAIQSVALSPRPPLLVRYACGPAKAGPPTLGQLNVAQWLQTEPGAYHATVGGELNVPAGARLDDVAEALAILLARHETLRTSFAETEPATQHVAPAGALIVDVYDIDGPDPIDRGAVADELGRRLRAAPPCSTPPLLMWVAVATRDGEVRAAVVGYSHLIVDDRALEILNREFAVLVGDPAARRLGRRRHQPLDQALLEGSPTVRRRTEAALSLWEDRLTRMSACLYAAPRTAAEGESLSGELSSPAAAAALPRVAARTGMSRSSAVLAAVCAVLARRTGHRELIFPTLSGNRFERHLIDYVGTLAQGTLLAVDIGPVRFDELIRGCWTAVVEASRNGLYHAYHRMALTERVAHQRGVHFDLAPLFNSVVVEDPRVAPGVGSPSPASAPSPATLRWEPRPATPTMLRFDLYQVEPVLRLNLWSGDTARMPRTEMRALLLAVERLLVAAAEEDLDHERVGRIIDLPPLDRGPGWLLIDSCWVELAEVQRLLDAALGPAVARVFPVAGGRTLVAYLAADGPARSPEEAHSRCMAALAGRHTAMAPQHYVVCATAPADPADAGAWTDVIAEGSGRHGCAAGPSGELRGPSHTG